MQMALNSALSALAAIPSALFWMEEPSVFYTACKSFDLVSVLCAGKSPPCRGCVHGYMHMYMALDRVVAWATRWRESAGNPFDRSVLIRAYNNDEAEDMSLFMCWSILRSELMVTPRM